MALINEKAKLTIMSNFSLSSDDMTVMSLLYAPLIGGDAYMLYMAFTALLERNNLKSEEYTHEEFFNIYSFKAKSFISAKDKLEGIGLLITYLDNDGNYLYIVNPPLTARGFLKDATLGLYLYSKVGKETFDQIYKHFKIEKIEKNNFQNITKSFDDVFDSILVSDQTYDKFAYVLGRKAAQSIKINHQKFDFDYFTKNIDKMLLETGITANFQTQIINLAFVYGFNEDEMVGLFNDSINKSGYYDYRLLKRNANTLFRFKRNMEAPKLKEKTEETEEVDNLVTWLENSSAKDILESNYKDFPPAYLETVNDIYANIDLPRGVLNVMILKVLSDKGGELPSLKYFKKMSQTWIEDNIFSTDDAIKYSVTAKIPEVKETKAKDKKDDNGGFNIL